MLREPKNTGMANKKTADSIRKIQKIPDKNRDDGEKTRQKPAQDRQKKCSGNPKIPVWLEKTRQAASVKCERFQMKIGITGEKHGRHLHKTGRKNAPGTEKYRKADKKRQVASAKRKRFRMKNRDDGEKTRRAPAQDRQKKMLQKPKNTKMVEKFLSGESSRTEQTF